MNGKRYALGLPAGSIRAMLTLMLVAIMCLLLVLPNHPRIPAHIVYLLLIAVTQFFAAVGTHRRDPDERAPLGLPWGSVRILVILLLVGVVVWRATNDLEGLLEQLQKSAEFLTKRDALTEGFFSPLFLPVLMLAGFFVGVVVHRIVGQQPPAVIQDLQAWLALVCLVGISIEAIITLVINTSLDIPLDLPKWNAVLATIVAFYFGARS